MNRTEQDKINRKEANQRYYKLEENKEQKRNYMKEYAKRPEVKAKAKEYYKNNKLKWGGKREAIDIYYHMKSGRKRTGIETQATSNFIHKIQKDL